MITLIKTPRTTYTFSVTVGGETFQPCQLLDILWSVKHQRVEIWDMSQKKINALNSVDALDNAVQKQLAIPGPKIDDYIADLTIVVRGDPDLSRLWDERYAMSHHTGI